MDVTDAYSTPALQAGTLTFLLTDIEGSTRRWQEEPEHDELPAEFPLLTSLDPHRHNLPLQLSSFVGREQEVTEVLGLLEKYRLVTLTGACSSCSTTASTSWPAPPRPRPRC